MSKSLEALELAILEFSKDLEEDTNNQWLKNVIQGLKEAKQDLERLEQLENRINNKIKELESEKFCYEMNGNDFSAHILRVQIKLLKEVLGDE